MATWCLPKEQANKFKQALKDGTINPQKMIDMTTQERRDFLASIIGDRDAAHANALFENKMLNKNVMKGLVTWAKRTMAEHPGTQKDLLSKIQRLEKRLDSGEIKIDDVTGQFGDLVNTRLGVQVSEEQFEQITELAQVATQKKDIMNNSLRRGYGEGATESELAYGLAAVELENYTQSIKDSMKKKPLLEYLKPGSWGETITEAAGIAKSLKATLDLSYTLRQGLKVLVHNPKIWGKNTIQEIKDVVNTFGEDRVMDYVRAEILSDPNYQKMKKDGLAIKVVEEEYPGSKAIEKIPGFGKLHKASEVAYTAFAYRSRQQLYNYYTHMMEQNGIEDTTGKGLGILVNAITGRGDLRSFERGGADTFNKLFFSPRFAVSNIEFLTAHLTDKRIDPVLKKEAAKALLKYTVALGAFIAAGWAVAPEVVETDPTSADFGKIKLGNTRVDITGGMGGFITLASRLVKGKSKSTTTGLEYEYGAGYGQTSRWDLVFDFFENKLAPASSLVKDLLQGEGWGGEPITPEYIFKQTAVPIIIQEAEEMAKDPQSANIILALICEGLGISANTYAANLNWDRSTAQKWLKRKGTMGVETFNNIVNQANNEYNQELISLRGKNLPQEELKSKIDELKKYLEKKYFP